MELLGFGLYCGVLRLEVSRYLGFRVQGLYCDGVSRVAMCRGMTTGLSDPNLLGLQEFVGNGLETRMACDKLQMG